MMMPITSTVNLLQHVCFRLIADNLCTTQLLLNRTEVCIVLVLERNMR